MSTELSIVQAALPAMSTEAIEGVRRLGEQHLATWPQIDLKMEHLIHAGTYCRTCRIPAGLEITGALIKIPTTLVIQGDCFVWLGQETRRITGYAVIPASAGRKQAFRAVADTYITMMFPTEAKTVPDAEREFTEEWRLLAPGDAETVITGEARASLL